VGYNFIDFNGTRLNSIEKPFDCLFLVSNGWSMGALGTKFGCRGAALTKLIEIFHQSSSMIQGLKEGFG